MVDGRRALVAGSQAELAAAEGRVDDARAKLEEALRFSGKIESAPQATGAAIIVAVTHILLGEPSEAIAAIEGHSGGGQDLWLTTWHAFAAGLLGEPTPLAAARARMAGEVFNSAGSLFVSDHLDALEAALAGRWDEARLDYRQAIEHGRELEYGFELSMLQLEYDAYLGGRFPEARAAGQEAEAWFATAGGTSTVETYRAAFRGTPAPPASATTPRTASAETTSEVESR
jgi:tetratricopeptide (TPR) repeat protein